MEELPKKTAHGISTRDSLTSDNQKKKIPENEFTPHFRDLKLYTNSAFQLYLCQV